MCPQKPRPLPLAWVPHLPQVLEVGGWEGPSPALQLPQQGLAFTWPGGLCSHTGELPQSCQQT